MKFVIILSDLRSAHNVGAIFRTADAINAEKIFLCGTTPKPGQPGPLTSLGSTSLAINRASRDLAKTALNAENCVAWEYKKRVGDVIKDLKQQGFQIVALEQDKKAVDIRKFRPKRKTAMILGYEVKGIGKNVLNKCDKIVYIPMFGKKESLNVSVAFGVAGYLVKFKS